jgi:ligand-binding sensor domain-containing protein
MNLSNLFLSFLLVIGISMSACNRLTAQDLDETNFVRYTRLQGLSNNYISGIVQDSTGYIWVATHKGLNRFDGNTLQSVFKSSAHSPLPDNLVELVHQQDSKEIIGATRAGAFAYYPGNGQYKKFIILRFKHIFWTNNVYDIVKDNRGTILFLLKPDCMFLINPGL